MNLKQDLENQGHSVRIVTRRRLMYDKRLFTMGAIREFHFQQFLNPKGGEVEVRIKTADGRFAKGVAICHHKDNFNKKLGLQMAFDSVFRQLGVFEIAPPFTA